MMILDFWRILLAVSTVALLTQSALAETFEDRLPSNSASNLLVQADRVDLVKVTGVQLNRVNTRLQIVLKTPKGQQLVPLILPEDNNLVVDLLDATLFLPGREEFRQVNPAPGIKEVTVTQLDDSSIRITISGANNTPSAEVVPSDRNLILSVTPETTAPEEADESIDVVVTATRTDEKLENVPRSVTVIEREQLQEQTTSNSNLSDVLGKLVPGFGPPTQERRTERNQTLRGRPALILIDGVPQNPNTGPFRQLNSIDSSAVERVEVVRGPSAIYGAGATGGIINIITRRPTDDRQRFQYSVGFRSDFTDFEEDSLGYRLQAGLSGREGIADYLLQLSFEDSGSFFDADGDRIPPLNPSNVSDVKTLNFLSKIGVDITNNQRLEFTYNNYFDAQETSFISDPSILAIPGEQTARAIDIGDINYDEDPEQSTQVFNLRYTNDKIFGSSQLNLQAYYTDTEVTQLADDLRPFFPSISPFIPSITQANFQTDKFGTRLQLDTPFTNVFGVLWGVDYVEEDNERLAFVLDPDAFDRRQGRIIGRNTDSPFFELDNLGLFAQAKWDVSDTVQLSGGVRYENISFSVDDYTVSAFADFTSPPAQIEGGSNTVDDVVFNLGTIYKVSPDLSLFANFAQGFAVPSLVLLGTVEAGFDFETDDLLEPEKVNNFELGVRGNWNKLQFSLAGFYNFSDRGQTFFIDRSSGLTDITRTPQRNYGFEATLDWQASSSWRLGGSFTWNEGDADLPDDGRGFLPLSTEEVQPFKLTTYIENETLPGWQNRLQLLYVGDRDRAFDEEVDPVEIRGYTTLDFFSTVNLGSGNLVFGIENLLNRDYLDLTSQSAVGLRERLRQASRGRTISVRYSVDF